MATALTAFRNKIIPHVPGCPFFLIDTYVRDAAIQFCEDTHILQKSFEVEDIDYTTVSAIDNDSLTVNLALYYTGYIPIWVVKLQYDGSDYKVKKFTLENDNSNLSAITEGSTLFFNFPSTTTMKIFPLSDLTSNFDLFISLAVKPTSTVISLDDFLYEDWRKAIEPLAIAELQRIPGKPWTNLQHAEINLGIYRAHMGAAKIRVADGFAKGNQIVTGGYF